MNAAIKTAAKAPVVRVVMEASLALVAEAAAEEPEDEAVAEAEPEDALLLEAELAPDELALDELPDEPDFATTSAVAFRVPHFMFVVQVPWATASLGCAATHWP